jgi:hypothetical protein
MDNNELESHIKEYEKEYRWLAEVTKLDASTMAKSTIWALDLVRFMRQYANDVQKEPEYQLNCDYCERLFWSKEAFPVRKMCTACYNNIVND